MAAYAPGGGVKVLHFATPAPMPPSSRQQQVTPRSAAERAATGYAPATRGHSAGYPRTPSQLKVECNPLAASVHGQPTPQHATRGGRPGMATPRHLHSSVGDIIFSGGWGGAGATRGSTAGVGGARLHEVGHSKHTPGKPLRDHQSTVGGQLLQHTFGAPPPSRASVGSRAHLSRAHLHHMASTADQVIFAKYDAP